MKSSSFIRALNDYKKEESEKKNCQGVFGIQVILKWNVNKNRLRKKNQKVCLIFFSFQNPCVQILPSWGLTNAHKGFQKYNFFLPLFGFFYEDFPKKIR